MPETPEGVELTDGDKAGLYRMMQEEWAKEALEGTA